ncbi:MAG: Lrp/AsnC family transcriptional regulator [Chloroflexi bacterium]|nr:Lrp/AsnC family transcriptional regulator [Chloroflexota bacterium]
MSTFDSKSAADPARLLDSVGRQILRLLQEDARLPFSEIGRQVGLTAPAVAERVKKMEEAGIITGFHAAVDPAKLGLGLTAYLHVTAHNGRCDPVRVFAEEQPAITECYCIAGDRDLLLKGTFESVEQLQQLVDHLLKYGSVSTTLVLATYLPRRSLG